MRKLTQPMIDLLSYVLRNGVLPAVVNTSTLRGLGEARGNLLTFSDTDPHAVQLSVSGVNELLAAWSADDTDLLGTTRFDGVMMVMHADAEDIDTSRTRFAETLDLALVDAETEAYDERHLHAPVLAVGDTVRFENMDWTVFTVSATHGVYLAADNGHKIWVPLASAWKLTKIASPVALAHPMNTDPFAGLPDNGTDISGDTSERQADRLADTANRMRVTSEADRDPAQDAADEPETAAPVWRAEFHPGRTSALYREVYDAVYAMRVKQACTAWLGRHHSGVCETCGRSIMTHTAHVDAALKFVAVCPTAASLSNIDPDELVKAAQQALERPSDVGYFGDKELWSVWGVVNTQGPDPSTLDASNWRVMLADLQGRAVHDDGDQSDDPAEYVDTETFSHWAFGYVTHMVVRVLVDTDGPLEASNLTYTFVRAVELAQSLQDYPVLDESDYSELESEGQEAAWDEHLWSSVEDELTKALTLDDFSQATLNLSATLPYSDTTVAELVKSTAPQDIVREFYYGHSSTMWREEGSSFYNEQHDEVMADMLSGLFVHDHVMCWSCEDSVEVLDNGTLACHTTLDIDASRAATPIGAGKLTHIRKHCHASGTIARPDHYHVMSFVEGYLPDGDIFCTTKASEARDAFLADLAHTRDSLECLSDYPDGCPDSEPCDHCQAHDDLAHILADFKAHKPDPAKGNIRVTYNDGRRLDIVHKIERVPASDCQV